MANTKKILIVEDDDVFYITVKDELLKHGFSVARASDGEEGLAAAKKENPDLILMDILLPKLDGITLAKNIKEAGIDAPIIFLTNLGDSEHISRALEVGKSDYLIKSDFSVTDMANMIKKKIQ